MKRQFECRGSEFLTNEVSLELAPSPGSEPRPIPHFVIQQICDIDFSEIKQLKVGSMYNLPILETADLSFLAALKEAGLRSDTAAFVSKDPSLAHAFACMLNEAFGQVEETRVPESEIFLASLRNELVPVGETKEMQYHRVASLLKAKGMRVTVSSLARELKVKPQAVSQYLRRKPHLRDLLGPKRS